MSSFRYDAIVFDFDGTLVDSNEIKTLAFGRLYKDYGEDIVHKVIAYHRENIGMSRFIKFRYWHEQLLRQPYTKEVEDELSQLYSLLVLDAVVEAPYIKGGLEFLKFYYQKLPLFVASGTPEKELREIVKRRDMLLYFTGVFGSPASKTEILKNIIRKHHYNPERVLMIGDTMADWEGAQSAETAFLGVCISKNISALPEGIHLNDLLQLESLI